MYNANNVRSLRKLVKEMKKGEKLYVNAISISINAVDQLRDYIKSGIITPDKSEVERVYNNVNDVMTGEVIFPQMTYIKQ